MGILQCTSYVIVGTRSILAIINSGCSDFNSISGHPVASRRTELRLHKTTAGYFPGRELGYKDFSGIKGEKRKGDF